MIHKKYLSTIYNRLYRTYGPQHWWPADTPFEVMVGAVLTQNTAWTNVEKAIANLKRTDSLNALTINSMTHKKLARLIKPSGYFNVKATRLKNFCRWFIEKGEFRKLNNLETDPLRAALLDVNGIGPETADDILLYAFYRPVFVIDIYTRRLFIKLGLIEGGEAYETLRNYFESTLPSNVELYNEYHALIVRHAKEKCLSGTACRHCKVEAPVSTRC